MKGVIKILVNICRLLLALTFIFSGYVKAIDPIGTQYKIQDYLEAVGMVGVVPDWITLSTSIFLSAVEFAVGICMFFAIRRRIVARITFCFMLVMTSITLWLVIANPIKDCGCFGDAIHLTNTQTLLKNVILLVFSAVLLKWPRYMIRFISNTNQWIAVNYTIIFIVASSIYCLYDLPMFDFRPYHVGASIPEGMKIPEGAKQPKFETTFILEKNGERKEFSIDNYPDSTWTFIDSKTVQTEEGFVPAIHDFSIENQQTGDDLTQQILENKGYTFLLIAPYVEQADDSNFGDIDQIYEYAQEKGYPFYCLTASNQKGINKWKDLTGAEYPFYTTDATTLKTIIRSNPGLLLLKNGIVLQKWSHNKLPKFDVATTPVLEKTEYGKLPSDNIPAKILRILLGFILPLLLLSIADRMWAWTKWVKRKENSNKIYQLFKRKENEKENCSR